MAEYLIQGKTLTDIADAIRAKTGSSEPLSVSSFATDIVQIQSGTDTSDATITSGSQMVEGITAYGASGNKITGTFTIDAEIAAQEAKIAEQDAIITNMMIALEGKAAGGSAKTTKTIYLDWSGDEERIGRVEYISNNEIITVDNDNNIETIEAEGGFISINTSQGTYLSNNFIQFSDNVYMATQDGETIHFVSSFTQQ